MFVHPSIGEIVFKEHDVVFSESTILDNYDVLGKLIDAHCFCALTGLKAFNDRVEFFYGSKEKFREVFASYLERASVSKNTSLSYTLCEYDLMDVVAEELRRVGWSFQEKNYKPAPKIEDIDSTLS